VKNLAKAIGEFALGALLCFLLLVVFIVAMFKVDGQI
jgi:hypothetical protein